MAATQTGVFCLFFPDFLRSLKIWQIRPKLNMRQAVFSSKRSLNIQKITFMRIIPFDAFYVCFPC
jgi:hypothetical protein